MLTILFDNASHVPLYQQLYNFIRKEIDEGRLLPGEKLPSKRRLATHLRLSQNTVEAAYNQLTAEGYVRAQAKSGYYVEDIGAPLIASPPLASVPSPDAAPREEALYAYDFRTNVVDTACFPFSAWAKITRDMLSYDKDELLLPTPPEGEYGLRQEIASYLHAYRGVKAAPEHIIVGAGSEYLLGLLVQILAWEGRQNHYGVENPGYYKTAKILRANGAPVSPLPLDGEGIEIRALRASGANIVHITPSHHFPLGTVMPVSRRRQLLAWAAEAPDRYLIEDDYVSEFRFSGRPIPALESLDSQGKVIYLNTFAQSLAPSLRISYMVLPPALFARYEQGFRFYASSVPRFVQHILRRFMAEGYFERHLARMRTLYKNRRNLFLEQIAQSSLAERIEIGGTEAGMHLLLSVQGMDEATLVKRAKQAGVRVYGLSEYYAEPVADMPQNTVIAGFSSFSDEELVEAVGHLLAAWQ